jgi:hypothetical protein
MSVNAKNIVGPRGAVALAGSALAALVLAACGGYGSSSTTPAGASAPRYGPHAGTAPKPVSARPAPTPAAGAAPHEGSSAPTTRAAETKPAPAGGEARMAEGETGAIPQNNGGDQDADNNGGPSDGDGNV